MWDWFTKNKRLTYIIVGLILILFVVAIMTKFWLYSIIAIGCFSAGFYYGRKSKNNKEPEGKRKGFL